MQSVLKVLKKKLHGENKIPMSLWQCAIDELAKLSCYFFTGSKFQYESFHWSKMVQEDNLFAKNAGKNIMRDTFIQNPSQELALKTGNKQHLSIIHLCSALLCFPDFLVWLF